MSIHPTAIIEEGASIADSANIGPYCVIGPDVEIHENVTLKAHVVVDGNKKIPKIDFPQTTLVKGDFRAEPVAAASIVAKVYRDNLMKELADKFPGYGLEGHKGYATVSHKEAIKTLGPKEIHRRSFAGVKEHLSI